MGWADSYTVVACANCKQPEFMHPNETWPGSTNLNCPGYEPGEEFIVCSTKTDDRA